MSFFLQLLGMDIPAGRDGERWWSDAPVTTSSAGLPITPDTAMKSSAVYACISIIAETIATLPLITYRRLPNGNRERAGNHPLYEVLHDRPNRDQTAFEFFEMMQGHAMQRGNAYARIVPGLRGAVDQLIPIHPDRVTVERGTTGVLRYRVRNANGIEEVLNQEDIFHLRGKSGDGITGVSVLTYARDAVGLALATEIHGSKIFSQGTRLSGVLVTDKTLDKGVQKRLKASWESTYSGLENAHRVAILEDGLKWQQMGMTSEDAQFLETRSFQVADIARWFRVPPHMIGETSKATSWGSGIEQMGIGFVVYTLMPWLVRWQQAIQRDLILAPQHYYAEFLVDALLRGDTAARYSAYKTGRDGGWLSVNDIRRAENMNAIPNGDMYLQPLNMGVAGVLPSDTANAHLMVREAAARVVSHEITSLADLTHIAEADAFYAKHAEFVAEVMHLPLPRAKEYTDWQRERLAYEGIESFIADEEVAIDMLITMVQEAHA